MQPITILRVAVFATQWSLSIFRSSRGKHRRFPWIDWFCSIIQMDNAQTKINTMYRRHMSNNGARICLLFLNCCYVYLSEFPFCFLSIKATNLFCPKQEHFNFTNFIIFCFIIEHDLFFANSKPLQNIYFFFN